MKAGSAPGARHHLGAERRRARIHEFERAADVVGRDHALLDQQLLDGVDHQFVGTGAVGHLDRLVRMVVAVHGHARDRARDRAHAMMVSGQAGLEPMLEDLELQQVLGAALVVGPDVGLADAHAVERALGQAVEAVGELLGIGELAAQPLDHAGAAARIDRHAAMAGRVRGDDAHRVARAEARGHRLPSISAMRRSISARVISPFSTTRVATATAHLSKYPRRR